MKTQFHTIFIVIVGVCILSSAAFAGGSTQANWYLRVDSTNAAPVTTGSISAVSQLLQGLTINSWGGTTATSPTNSTQITTSQRMYVTNATAGFWPGETVLVPSRFAQYVAAPLTGTTWTVDSISMCIGDNIGNNSMMVDIYYYVGSDTTNFLINATKLNSAIQYGITAAGGYQTPTYKALSISVASGKNLYLRVYPYYGTAKTGKYVQISNVTIAGSTNPALAAGRPVVTTAVTSYISTTSLACGGRIWADSGAIVTTRGVCWSTSSPAFLGSANFTSDGTGTGSFTSSVTGLTAGKTYYIRSYATNSAGTSYGSEITVATYAAVVVPSVTTNAVTSISVNTALCGGKILDWGGAAVTAKGLCWSKTANPTLSNSMTVDGTDIASFTRSMSGLSAATTYHVRAYATNSAGTGFGGDTTFTTATPKTDTTVVVAKDGSGNYTTIGAALRNVPANYTGKYTVFVKKGIYFERDTVLATSYNVNLVGENRDSTIITHWTYSDDPAISKAGTSATYTFLVLGFDFVAKNITFQNTYWPNRPDRGGSTTNTQAVALMTNGGDRHEFINCAFRGYQDTYYAGGGSATSYGRAYFKKCLFTGTVDYIFGRGLCVFDSCTTVTMSNAGTSITAASTESSALYGLVFRNCTLLADSTTYTDSCGYTHVPITKFYLGRPWQSSPRAVYLHCNEPATLASNGWTIMQTNPLLFAEYNCYGAGARKLRDTTGYFNWPTGVQPRQLTSTEASTYSLATIFAKNSANSTVITYDWMPTNATVSDNVPFIITSVEKEQIAASIPRELKLYNNFPNPFNPSTQIQFAVPRDGHASLKIYNLVGQEVATLFDDNAKSGQVITREFSGNTLASGVYFARLQFHGTSLVQRMMLLK
jgi:pectin methylesterase-like acyl-CoA thioesterase